MSGRRTATTGLLAEYLEETEGLEYVGERLALLDGDGRSVATVEIIGVERTTFAGVTREHAAAEGEGAAGLEDWRAGHRRIWSAQGAPVRDDTPVVCLAFRVRGGEGLKRRGRQPTPSSVRSASGSVCCVWRTFARR